LLTKIVEPSQIISRPEARECQEVTHQVRLIKISMVQSELCPIGRRESVHHSQDTLKSPDTIEKPRFQAHFEPEHIDESPIAQAGLSSQLADDSA